MKEQLGESVSLNGQLKKLMETPMSRKEFLRYVGVLLLSAMGVGNVISAILKSQPKAVQAPAKLEKRGFGGGKYGV